ncbi:MAG: hypothetical protein ACR2GK_07045, partial [Gemmatimonadaceae bacterium]
MRGGEFERVRVGARKFLSKSRKSYYRERETSLRGSVAHMFFVEVAADDVRLALPTAQIAAHTLHE